MCEVSLILDAERLWAIFQPVRAAAGDVTGPGPQQVVRVLTRADLRRASTPGAAAGTKPNTRAPHTSRSGHAASFLSYTASLRNKGIHGNRLFGRKSGYYSGTE